MLNEIKDLIRQERFAVISFDIFDTLLQRPLADPSDLFCLMQEDYERLTGRKDDFRALRRQAEVSARNHAGMREDVCLEDIYRELAAQCQLSDKTRQALMSCEQTWELKLIQPRPSGCGLLRYAQSCGKRVVLISDMVLDAQTLGRMLRKCGVDGWERLFVSGEVGKIKSSGNLFRHAAKELGVKPGQMLHIGDHPTGDGEAARWTGLAARVHPRPMTRLHREYTPDAYEDGVLGAGCLQALAANRFLDGSSLNREELTGYAVLGPAALAAETEPESVAPDASPAAINAAHAFMADWRQLQEASGLQELPPVMGAYADFADPAQVLRGIAALRKPGRHDRPLAGSPMTRRIKYLLYRAPGLRKALGKLKKH